MRKYGESKTTRIMMATVPHVIPGLGLRQFQADGSLLTRVYNNIHRLLYIKAIIICFTILFIFFPDSDFAYIKQRPYEKLMHIQRVQNISITIRFIVVKT